MENMKRERFLQKIEFAFSVNPIVAILGPRQCGKTTISRQYLSLQNDFSKENYFDLENYKDINRLEDPMLILEKLSGLIVIDEIQKIPELFPSLRVLADNNKNQRYLILGSASRDLIKQSSETLAGRIGYLELTPFNYEETKDIKKLWIRGGYPLSFLANNLKKSDTWRNNFIKTYLERDIPNLGINIPYKNLRRFWMMLSHYHGNIFNSNEIGKTLGFSSKTMRNYLDILSGTFMVRELKPWFENIKKRQVKSSKIYIRDSGIFHSLISVVTDSDLYNNPKMGSSWEGFALEEIIRALGAEDEECYFWATHQNAELDLLIVKDGKKYGFEIKHSASCKLTKSMKIAFNDLSLDELTVIYPGNIDYFLSDKIEVVGLENYLNRKKIKNLL